MRLLNWMIAGAVVAALATTSSNTVAKQVGPNLFPNPGFEEVADGQAAGIDLTFQEGKPSIELGRSVARTGQNSMRITTTERERGAIGRRIPLDGGKTYRFSAWYKSSPGVKPAAVTLRLMFFNSPTSWNDADKVALTREMLLSEAEGAFRLGMNNHIDGTLDAALEWRQIRMTVRVPEKVVSVSFQLFNWKGTGTIWVDDVAAAEVELSEEDLAALAAEARAAQAEAAAAKAKARNESAVAKALPGLRAHPRLLATAEDFSRLRQYVAGDPTARTWARIVQVQANAILPQPVSEYVIPDGLRLLATSRRVLDRIQRLMLTFKLTDDRRYLNRAWQELEAAARFPDWNPRHFLDTAEMTAAFAFALDWAYNDWTAEQRAVLRTAIVEKGLKPGLRFYEGSPIGTNFVTAVHNWNFVCNGGMALGALAVLEEERDLALDVLNAGLKSLPAALAHFAPDGAWSEGVGYWHYSIRYLVPHMAALQTALGTDFGLSRTVGLAQTGLFPIHMTGPTKKVFNYADGGSGTVGPAEMYWMAHSFGRPGYAWWQNMITGPNIGPLDLLWYRPGLIPEKSDDLPLDAYFRDVEVVSMRSSWTDPDALWVGFKAGDNTANHGNLDLGTFIMEAQGVRWAEELGADDYNLPGYFSGSARWNFYRTRAEGQNTLVINPGKSPDQDPSAEAAMTFQASSPGDAVAVADITPAYTRHGATKVKRGVALLENRRYVIVQDEVALNRPGEVWWFMHTKAAVEIQPDGASAVMAQGGRRMLVRLLAPAGARLTVMPARPLRSSPTVAGQNANDGIRKLSVHLGGVTEARIAVQFVPLDPTGGAPLPESPDVKPLAEWRTAYVQ